VRLLRVLALIVFAVLPSVSFAQSSSPAAQAIRAVMDKQVVDWNKGDIPSFAASYKNSPDILFMSTKIYRGYAAMLERYRTAYPTREAMGKLTFSELDVQPLSEQFATVTGHFHLERTAAGGGDARGYFLLVFEKTPDGWKIVRDDTTASK
jgi:ketosteroid isomerase-like protein